MSAISEHDFVRRHIGPDEQQINTMLQAIGCSSLEALIDQTIPSSIRVTGPLDWGPPMPEHQFLRFMREVALKNKKMQSYIGMGYYNTVTPAVLQRNLLENPGWYTPYTPYQAEIAQGRLESLLNYQTMVGDLTGMDIANASLLDEATAAAEAMIMLLRSLPPSDRRRRFWVSSNLFPQTLAVVQVRAEPLGIELVMGDEHQQGPDAQCFGALVQYPDGNGKLWQLEPWIKQAHQAGVRVAVASDLMALTLIKPPGEMGADVCLGSSQRFGVPLGYGGPHAAFFAARKEFLRHMPGRIIGVSIDAHGRRALRMTLQTREQHIKREKATSNICTAQALLANLAAMYAVYHGPQGLKAIAQRIHRNTCRLRQALVELEFQERNETFFDTLKLTSFRDQSQVAALVRPRAEEAGFNFRYFVDGAVGISLDETVTDNELNNLIKFFASLAGKQPQPAVGKQDEAIPNELIRTSPYLQHPVFNSYHSETRMMRYIRSLERKDIGLDTSMIPLGSCTMKLNAASEMIPISYSGFAHLHPFVPTDQAEGYQQIFRELEELLCRITGMAACSLQPNSGAQGEYAGLMVIRAYHRDHGQHHRDVALIPASAHGTNPASAVMAGMQVVVVKSDENGNIDLADLKAKAHAHRDRLACLMVTYPSTHGIFEASIREVTSIIHECGGLVYMDGANMNAQVGLTTPAAIGADVNHLNLHKTFAIPHGGGGPGMGPICVTEALRPYLPSHPVIATGGAKAIGPVSATPWGSSSILLISYGYLKLLGARGALRATQVAILNANYLMHRLQPYYQVLYKGPNGRCAHEFIIDLRPFRAAGIEVDDVAKRLMDYGFHAPTVSFPVPGTMMIEPTESEDLNELDRFAEAMISIHGEILEVVEGKADPNDNVLKNAPHTLEELLSNEWPHTYSREKAAFPLPYLRHNKLWPAVGRINNTYGDRNIVCVCPPVESYAHQS
ncbi:MAG: aminomethyl-transferring glycine dehydrogenase [Chitinophagales bacterium]|nr:aminomethyl-transferring glycine dehydrogenase [Chitinophagales bacterium]MDW8427625.1 aminomethyl-transferring glycine dehydrogenase [Chitinophagales bacterium]